MEKKKVDFWEEVSCEYDDKDDELRSKYLDDAIEATLCKLSAGSLERPETLVMGGYKYNDIRIPTWSPLTKLIQKLDDYNRSPNVEGTIPSEEMREAEREFVGKVISHYKKFRWEEVDRLEICVDDWLYYNDREYPEDFK